MSAKFILQDTMGGLLLSHAKAESVVYWLEQVKNDPPLTTQRLRDIMKQLEAQADRKLQDKP